MRHRELNQKLVAAKEVYDWLQADSERTCTEAGKEFEESYQLMGRMFHFYKRNKDKPVLQWAMDESQADIDALIGYVGSHEQLAIRHWLIKNFNAMIDSHKRCYTPSKRIIRAALKYSGLEWGELNGKPVVHWKHDKEIQ